MAEMIGFNTQEVTDARAREQRELWIGWGLAMVAIVAVAVGLGIAGYSGVLYLLS